MSDNEILRKLMKKLVACRKELEEERQANKFMEFRLESYKDMREVAQEVIHEEVYFREKSEEERNQAEYDKEYYAKELEEERRLRLEAEYVREYYEMQLVEYGLGDMVMD